ncbi:flagellar biosynthesis protein FlhB [Rhodospirillum rubrum]|uniref:Flagellar biosynthetic protein FlhB n=1 Tax=Rhodospirillum rubrum (strain ATCC 11170 / ATH 1.1.1 / DSM 467 / LMG 4362 / NCIMB 8255 / S1) TaxID=269796 RepID=Q2RQH7_RHORT|nr:flagellar biosynthesis protein FlhB [Rhodospirillum rubrum]ABC23618.1 Flagellar biosynthetic protein FlhB [Rhodospirillum rubrum ATCC 11170]AEO49356.1 flagellar biosynthesis protein FlhB [Rhodospirillum rubrum F11]MBK5955295.1 flagellar biosynthesis protein FlhB [Rhodospirillum rubrum]QXG79579.1 flagellar biosynthesis protein FlhB [Rhodospirillum rubrum]
MADDDKDSKTEDPSSRKLGKAREDGQVAQSQEVKSFLMLGGALFMVAVMGGWIADKVALRVRVFLEQPDTFHLDAVGLRDLLARLLLDIGLVLAMPIAMFIVLAILGGVGQFGLIFSAKKITPELQKISPLAGFKRLFSVRALVEGVKGIVKVVVVSAIVAALMLPRLRTPELFMDQDILVTLGQIHRLLVVLLISVVTIVGAIAAADFAFQKYKHIEELKMTKQEVKDEHKNAEGDPQIKSKIRQLRMRRARERMMARVPEASVVITNPTHFAVALKYDMDMMSAPVLVAKGQDFIALKIREVAEENEVPIVENPPLARALFAAVEIDHEIPPDHYKAVAEVIGYVMRLKKATKR